MPALKPERVLKTLEQFFPQKTMTASAAGRRTPKVEQFWRNHGGTSHRSAKEKNRGSRES
jgi:hypothetical protein